MFARRRARFMEAMGPDAVALIAGASLISRSHDSEYPFRQNSDFWYLTGFDHPDAVAILRTDGGPAYSLFVQPRDRAAEAWTGYRPGVEGAMGDYAADAAHDRAELANELPGILRKARRVYHQLGPRPEIDRQWVEIQETLRRESKTGVEPARELIDPRSILHEMRLVKEDGELALMRQAAEISREAHCEAAKLARAGRYEYELQAALEYVFRRRGARGPAYNSIVAGGAGAATLHYVSNDQVLREGELVLIDAGAELAGYASDVTRTYPVGGRFQGAQRDVYDVVFAAQQAALGGAGPGVTLPEIHQRALRVLVDGMIALRLLTGLRDALIESEAYKRYYMHGTSHWLGLDVHDAGLYVQDGKPRRLQAGMVFTVEPGLYIAADDEQAPAALRGIGVRIEDNILITDEGFENLTESIPKVPAEVEAWVLAD